MALFYTLLCTLIQIFFYRKHNQLDNVGDRYKILTIIFLTNTFFTPRFFIPDLDEMYDEGRPRCGVPEFATHLYFFIIGNGIAIITHFIFYLIRKKSK